MFVIENLGILGASRTVGLLSLNRYAVPEHLVLCLIGLQQGIADEHFLERFDSLLALVLRQVFVQLDQSVFEVALKENVVVAFAAKGSVFAQNLIVKAIVDAPAHTIQQLTSGLLNGFLLRVTATHSNPRLSPSRQMICISSQTELHR